MIEDSTKFELTDELKEKIDNILQAHDYDYTQNCWYSSRSSRTNSPTLYS